MNCENCIHYKACLPFYENIEMKPCDTFEDKDLYIKLPCKVGDNIYRVVNDGHPHVTKDYVNEFKCGANGWEIGLVDRSIALQNVNKIVFLTKEEAEAALKK